MLKIQQIFPKLYRCFFYVVFQNLKLQNAGLVDVKKELNFKKRSKGIFVRENLKNKHRYYVNGSGDTLMHKAEHPSNKAEQIKKAVICVQILLEIHLT